MWLVYILSIVAALCFGTGSVVQQRAASKAPPQDLLSWRLLLWLVKRKLWLIGVATAVVGNICSAVALGRGSVALVQPLLVVRLLFALPLAAAWARRSVPRRDWGGAIAAAAGLAIFVVAGHPHQAQSNAVSDWHWVIAGTSILALSLSLAVASRRLSPPRQAAMLGAGAGFLFGLQSGLTGPTFNILSHQGVVATLTSWKLYAVIVVALTATLLIQSAYEAAPLPASFPLLVTTEPLTGIALGVGVLGGDIRMSPLPLAVEIAGLGVMCVGIYLLGSSPLVTGELDRLERRQEEGLAYRTEDELERDLARLHRDLDEFEAQVGADGHRGNGLKHLHRDIERVDREVARLCELQEDIQRHRKAERERVESRSLEEQAAFEEHDDHLDASEQEIDRRAERLRDLAERLEARARELEKELSEAEAGG